MKIAYILKTPLKHKKTTYKVFINIWGFESPPLVNEVRVLSHPKVNCLLNNSELR